jgi:hypothetical protein
MQLVAFHRDRPLVVGADVEHAEASPGASVKRGGFNCVGVGLVGFFGSCTSLKNGSPLVRQ